MFKVQKNKCNQCLFTKDKVVGNSRRNEVIRTCLQEQRFFVCHKSNINESEGNVCCKGWFDTYGSLNPVRMAKQLGVVEFVEVRT